MATRLFSVVFDASDHIALGRWWASALELSVAGERDNEAWIEPRDAPELIFVPVPEPKTSKNRIHLDLASTSPEHQQAIVDRLISLGAKHAEIGQRDIPWVVLSDPEGNEFCVLEPRETYVDATPVAAIVIDTHDVEAQTAFWQEASGWAVERINPWGSRLRRPDGVGPYLEPTKRPDAMTVKNRVHIDVAPALGDDHAAEVERLITLGARRIDIGQGDVPWTVLADPEDNEFCVLTPR